MERLFIIIPARRPILADRAVGGQPLLCSPRNLPSAAPFWSSGRRGSPGVSCAPVPRRFRLARRLHRRRRPTSRTPQREGERQVAPVLTGADARDDEQLRPARGRPGHPCRARPRRRFRGASGWPARRRSTSRRRDGRAGDRPRQQGARDRAASPTPAGGRCNGRSARATRRRGQPLTVRIGDARRIAIRYRSAPDAEALQWLTPGADRGQAPSLSVQPGPGDPQPHLDPDPGQPRHPPDLGGADHRARAAEGGDVGRAADARGRAGRRRPPRLPLPDEPSGRALSDRDRRRRHRLPRARPAHRRLDRAGDARPRRRRARRHRADGRGGRAALRPLSLGPLRRDRAAAALSLMAAWRIRPSPS